MNYFCPKSIFNPILQWGYKKCTLEKLGKNTGSSLGVWDPRTKTKAWFPPHLADIDGTVSLTKILEGDLGISEKIKKKWKISAWSHGE
jgi:hypothetical protein